MFTLANPYVQISSIMPQKRNPVSIEHMRSLLSAVVGDTNTVLTMVHNTPFGDIVDTEDDMQPFLWKSMDRLIGIYQLFGSVVLTMNVNKENLLKRAQNSFANVTELARYTRPLRRNFVPTIAPYRQQLRASIDGSG